MCLYHLSVVSVPKALHNEKCKLLLLLLLLLLLADLSGTLISKTDFSRSAQI